MAVACLLFIASFTFYLSTMSGTIPVYRDSGDLINAIYTLGIAHPPGYPTYVVLGKLFSALIPFGTPAFRTNLFSAVAAAGASALLYVVMRKRFQSAAPRGAAVGAILLFACTPAVTSLARVSEMYALAAVWAVAIIGCWQGGTLPFLRLGCFLLGLGFGVHPTLLFLTPLLISLKPREAFTRILFFACGFSIVLVLWVRAHGDPLQNWGNPSTLDNLWQVISRSNYGGLKLHPVESEFAWTLTGICQQLGFFIRTLWEQWGAIGLAAGLFGLCFSYKKDRRLIAAGCLAGPLFIVLSNLPLDQNTTAPILQPYFVLVNVIWAVWVAQGVWQVALRLSGIVLPTILVSTLVVVGGTRALSSFDSQREDRYAYDLGRNMLRTLPSKAVLYDPDDQIAFTLRSLQLTEGRRPNIVLLNFFRTRWGYEQIRRRSPDLFPNIPINNGPELDRALWTYSIGQRPFFVDLPAKLAPGLSYDAAGILYRVRTSPGVSALADLARAERDFEFYVWPGDWKTTHHPDFFTQHIVDYRASARCNLGLKYAEQGHWDAARRCYKEALAINPELSAAYNDLGVVDFSQNKFAAAVSNYKTALRIDPRNAGYQRNLELAEQRVPIEK